MKSTTIKMISIKKKRDGKIKLKRSSCFCLFVRMFSRFFVSEIYIFLIECTIDNFEINKTM